MMMFAFVGFGCYFFWRVTLALAFVGFSTVLLVLAFIALADLTAALTDAALTGADLIFTVAGVTFGLAATGAVFLV